MRKRQWPTLRFAQLHVRKIICSLVAALLLIPPGLKAQETGTQQEARPQDAPGQTAFGGTYVIHLSEGAQAQSSHRPEPGYFDTLVIELFKSAGLDVEILPQTPWKRQIEQAERETGHVIYPTTRIDHREDAFQWVGPVSRTFWNLYGFAESGWSDMAFDSVLRDARIGVLLGSAREQYLRDRGAKQLVQVPREELLLPMMMAGRVDLIAVGANILRHYVDRFRAGDRGEILPSVVGIKPYRLCYLYIAISGDVPKGDIIRLQNQLDSFKTDGFFVENRRAHGLSTNTDSAFLKAMLDLDHNGVTCVDLKGNDPQAP